MKSKFYITSLLCLFIFPGFAAVVDLHFAQRVAENFIQSNTSLNSIVLHPCFPEKSFGKEAVFYVFNINQKDGFIIVAADDASMPILGYTTAGTYGVKEMPANFESWMKDYAKEIFAIRANHTQPSAAVSEQWQKYQTTIARGTENFSKVDPLLKTTWSQSPYYNDLCPGGSVTGCGATAMAQIMKYWNYPTQGTGFSSYNHATYGTLSANYGNTTYEWSKMPNSLNSKNSAVATLMLHCGIAQEMDYTVQTSTSYMSKIVSAFTTYFGYKKNIQFLDRANFDDNTWVNMLKTELDNSKPLLYRGLGPGGGHFFVFDGYDNNSFFHINWGWGGLYDGFFNIKALNPAGVGTGGGTGGYNSGHYAILSIQPEQVAPGSFDINMYSAITFNPTKISANAAFSVTAKIANLGTSPFTGEFAAAVFNKEGVFIDYIEILLNKDLQNGFYNTYTFSTSGMPLIPGEYTAALYYRLKDKNWVLVKPNTYANPTTFVVEGAKNDLKVYSKIDVSKVPIVQNEPFNITASVANYGAQKFTGWLSTDLFDVEGNWLQTIQEIPNFNLSGGFFLNGIQFSSAGLKLPPGSYYIALISSPDYKSWTLLSNDLNPNPIKITIVAPQIAGDKYEPNNTKNTAFQLPVTFSGNQCQITTTGSNLHNATDFDYYKVVLPAGYDYEIGAYLGDRFNPIQGVAYDADVIFSYDAGSGSSGAFDVSLLKNILLKNGGTVSFFVAPYSEGNTGTYVLNLNITRTKSTSINDLYNPIAYKISPNPARSVLTITTEGGQETPTEIRLFNHIGQLVKLINLNNESEVLKIDISDLPNGQFYLEIKDKGNKRTALPIVILH